MHKTVVIICDGRFPKSDYPRYLVRSADFIICCDGALRKFLRASEAIFGEKRLPDVVVGDMDSLSPARGIADSVAALLYPYDRLGNRRKLHPDAGCYEYME